MDDVDGNADVAKRCRNFAGGEQKIRLARTTLGGDGVRGFYIQVRSPTLFIEDLLERVLKE